MFGCQIFQQFIAASVNAICSRSIGFRFISKPVALNYFLAHCQLKLKLDRTEHKVPRFWNSNYQVFSSERLINCTTMANFLGTLCLQQVIYFGHTKAGQIIIVLYCFCGESSRDDMQISWTTPQTFPLLPNFLGSRKLPRLVLLWWSFPKIWMQMRDNVFGISLHYAV